ncbi:hypothetical protein HAX54_003722 [Datura stramonium]|uniref:Uncharacterized protein n=1 Tax=Datura stramonium TaxID=4076 RepID=A0ABS8T713_DATST|nr:hypothetical protein [Datura stramonium]
MGLVFSLGWFHPCRVMTPVAVEQMTISVTIESNLELLSLQSSGFHSFYSKLLCAYLELFTVKSQSSKKAAVHVRNRGRYDGTRSKKNALDDARALRRKDGRGERPWGDTVCDPWISDRETRTSTVRERQKRTLVRECNREPEIRCEHSVEGAELEPLLYVKRTYSNGVPFCMMGQRGKEQRLKPLGGNLEYRPRSFVQTDFLGKARIQSREGNSPDRTLECPKQSLSGKGSDRAMTPRRAQVIHPSDETLKAAFSSVSSGTFWVNRGRLLVTRPGDIRSENADMSNENPVKNTIACRKVFCVQSIYAENCPQGTPKGLPSDGYTKVTKLLLTTEPCLSVGANYDAGPRAAPLSSLPF